jgi:hypothetical protein
LPVDAKDRRAADWYMSHDAVEGPRNPLSLVFPFAVIVDVMDQVGRPFEPS